MAKSYVDRSGWGVSGLQAWYSSDGRKWRQYHYYGIVGSGHSRALPRGQRRGRQLTKAVAVEMGAFPGENEAIEMLTMRTPAGRLGVPRDTANGVLFLASEESEWVNGSETGY